jgi:hypothetical protein
MTTYMMVVEHFRNKDAVLVYRRFRDRGRMAREGLLYLDSVITAVATYPFWMAYRVRLATSWISSFAILRDRRHAGDEKREAAIHSKGCMKHSGPSF